MAQDDIAIWLTICVLLAICILGSTLYYYVYKKRPGVDRSPFLENMFGAQSTDSPIPGGATGSSSKAEPEFLPGEMTTSSHIGNERL